MAEARGKGNATEAGKALMAIADRAIDQTILTLISPGNTPSQRVAIKLGFQHLGETTSVGHDVYERVHPIVA